MLIEIHMLKNYPATNLNRDDAGMPKTAIFGNVLRGRISSQCLKFSWRQSPLFRKTLGESMIGIRTKKVFELVGYKLQSLGISEDYFPGVLALLAALGLAAESDGKSKKKEKGEEEMDDMKSKQLLFYAPSDIDALANAIKTIIEKAQSPEEFNGWFKKTKESKKDKDNNPYVKEFKSLWKKKALPVTVDIALFGRMITSDVFANVEGALQVSHAISVNKAVMETDYFTALDDLLDIGNENGAAHLGDNSYNSCCYYIYASLDVDKLVENLHGLDDPEGIASKVIPALLQTMVFTDPHGKQNSFAGHVLPSVILVERKDKPAPLSYVNAFVAPVKSTNDTDMVTQAVNQLKRYVAMLDDSYQQNSLKRYWFFADRRDGDDVQQNEMVIVCDNFPSLLAKIAE